MVCKSVHRGILLLQLWLFEIEFHTYSMGIKSSQCLMKKRVFCCKILLRAWHSFQLWWSCFSGEVSSPSTLFQSLLYLPLCILSPSIQNKKRWEYTIYVKAYHFYTWRYKRMIHLYKSMLRAYLMSTSHSSLTFGAEKLNLSDKTQDGFIWITAVCLREWRKLSMR